MAIEIEKKMLTEKK